MALSRGRRRGSRAESERTSPDRGNRGLPNLPGFRPTPPSLSRPLLPSLVFYPLGGFHLSQTPLPSPSPLRLFTPLQRFLDPTNPSTPSGQELFPPGVGVIDPKKFLDENLNVERQTENGAGGRGGGWCVERNPVCPGWNILQTSTPGATWGSPPPRSVFPLPISGFLRHSTTGPTLPVLKRSALSDVSCETTNENHTKHGPRNPQPMPRLASAPAV